MALIKAHTPEAGTSGGVQEIRLLQGDVDHKSWWQWWNTIAVIVLLLVAIIMLFLPKLAPKDHASVWFLLDWYALGFLGIVLALSVHMLYRQHTLTLLRNQIRTRTDNLYELAVLDPLTGLYNRRFVEDRLRAEIARAERHGDALMVLLLDLDAFKRINDRFGHAAGDLVLREVAHRIRRAVRASDFAVRMGGDEFLVLLPECPSEKVDLVLSRLAPFDMNSGEEKISVSISAGYAQYQPGETVEHLVGRADEALYARKAARVGLTGLAGLTSTARNTTVVES